MSHTAAVGYQFIGGPCNQHLQGQDLDLNFFTLPKLVSINSILWEEIKDCELNCKNK